jgi:hypothetical protein
MERAEGGCPGSGPLCIVEATITVTYADGILLLETCGNRPYQATFRSRTGGRRIVLRVGG